MMTRAMARLLLIAILIMMPKILFATDEVKPAGREKMGFDHESVSRELRDFWDRWRKNFGVGAAREERPLISLMLRNRERLGLSADQIKNLERIRNDFTKESIKSDADLRIAEMDLDSLLEAQPVEMTQVEAKIREIERIRGDLRIARVQAIEKGKEQLSADQRRQFRELLADQNLTRFYFSTQR
ncbi:MAG: periplasmic heavy metal sensor [Deltaproteobacteria bacterium]|nr:periplasmic heavy metal sensor [Deltaproteobacteria bacterium]